MAPRLSGQTSIFGVVSFVSKSLMGIEGQRKLEKFAILTRKPRSHAWILIYRTWPIALTRHFGSTANSKDRRRKTVRMQETIVHKTKLSRFKSYRFKVPTLNSGLKIFENMTKLGRSYFGFVRLCVYYWRQSQSDTKKFRIRLESGTISSSVNLV